MRRYRLEFDEDGDHRVVKIAAGESITLGRALACDVVVPHGLVSGSHALVEADDDGLVITDLGSKNGTWIDRQRITQPGRVCPGDRFALGAVKVKVGEDRFARTAVKFADEAVDVTQVLSSIDTSEALLDDDSRAKTFGEMAEASRSLAVIHEVGSILLSATDEDELCVRLLDLLFDVLPADRACLITREDTDEMVTRAVRSRGGEDADLTVSRTILRKTIDEGLSLLTSDAASDERFKAGDSILLGSIRAAMCVPLRGKERVLGALYVDTQIARGVFRRTDLELLTTLGIQGGVAIENLRLSRANLKAERLAAIGGVMAGLSHDIRNILTALRTGAYLMDQIIEESESNDLGEAWDIVRHGTDTITLLVEDMVSYSKEREPLKEPTDLNLLVSQVCERYGATAAERGASLDSSFSDQVGEVPVEASAIDRVLSNLIGNALDAVAGEDGEIVVSTSAPNGNSIAITVSDNGPGIDPEHLERIFDLLFSTKGSKGTGFGLAVSRKLVKEHGGTITVDSTPGEGAVFTVALPRA
jgi:two-component system, NtrC family, sensor kinase